MHRFLLTVAAATSILAIDALVSNRTEATPLGSPLAVEGVNPIEKVALCFYIDGWNGPGLYECGYRFRRGEGWQGPQEEHREDRMHRREERREEGRMPRREDRREEGRMPRREDDRMHRREDRREEGRMHKERREERREERRD